MKDREELINELKDADPILEEGNRNNDSVNLAIVAYDDAEGKIEDGLSLFNAISELIDNEGIKVKGASDFDYLRKKCGVLIHYLPRWYRTNIYQFAI